MNDRANRRMGRPPKEDRESILTERVSVPVSPDMKQWVLGHGGAGYIRRLVEKDMKRAFGITATEQQPRP